MLTEKTSGAEGQGGIRLPCFNIPVLGLRLAMHVYMSKARFCNHIRIYINLFMLICTFFLRSLMVLIVL